MFESSFTALHGVLSRSFIVGAFLPVLVALAINFALGAMASVGLAGSVSYLSDSLHVPDVATAIGILTLASLPLAFVLSPLLVPFRLLLEGQGLPQCIREDMIRAGRKRADKALIYVAVSRNYIIRYLKQELEARTLSPIIEERRKNPEVRDTALIDQAEKAVNQFASAADALRHASFRKYEKATDTMIEKFADATRALRAALEENAMDNLPFNATETQDAAAAKLSKAYDRFRIVIVEAREDARLEAGRRDATMDRLLIAKDPRPTRLGNVRAQFDEYTRAAYDADFSYLWPRLRMGIDYDESKFEPVEQAETQLSFALMLLLLTLISSVAWLGYLMSTRAVLSLIVVGITLPILNYLFYLVVVESQRALLVVTRAAIDRLRQSLLIALHRPPPKDYEAELVSWKGLQSLSQGSLKGQDFLYDDPPKTTP